MRPILKAKTLNRKTILNSGTRFPHEIHATIFNNVLPNEIQLYLKLIRHHDQVWLIPE